jgi:hypothetical protein
LWFEIDFAAKTQTLEENIEVKKAQEMNHAPFLRLRKWCGFLHF